MKQQTGGSELIASLQHGGWKAGKQTEKERDGKKFESLDVFRFGTCDSPSRQALFLGRRSELSMDGCREWDRQRDICSLGWALLQPTLPFPAGVPHSLIPSPCALFVERLFCGAA